VRVLECYRGPSVDGCPNRDEKRKGRNVQLAIKNKKGRYGHADQRYHPREHSSGLLELLEHRVKQDKGSQESSIRDGREGRGMRAYGVISPTLLILTNSESRSGERDQGCGVGCC